CISVSTLIIGQMNSILQAQIVATLRCWDTRKEIKRGQNVAVQQPKPTPSFAGQFLKDYRKAHNLSQEQLAYDLCMEPRTLRAYENGERQLNNINELRRIADLLGIEPERLGLASSISIPRTPEHIEAIARTLNDHTLLNIALTYQGDMYRRLGKHTQAITYLEAARDTTPHADNAAKGNGMQLLGRAYLRVVLAGNTERMQDFERAM